MINNLSPESPSPPYPRRRKTPISTSNTNSSISSSFYSHIYVITVLFVVFHLLLSTFCWILLSCLCQVEIYVCVIQESSWENKTAQDAPWISTLFSTLEVKDPLSISIFHKPSHLFGLWVIIIISSSYFYERKSTQVQSLLWKLGIFVNIQLNRWKDGFLHFGLEWSLTGGEVHVTWKRNKSRWHTFKAATNSYGDNPL